MCAKACRCACAGVCAGVRACVACVRLHTVVGDSFIVSHLSSTHVRTHTSTQEAEADISQSVSVHVRNADTMNLGRLAVLLALP